MQAKSFIFILVASLLTLAGCLKNPVDVNRDIQRQLSDNNRKPRENEKSIEPGGRPGDISLNGVIVQSNGVLDSRISLVSRAGIGRDGHEAEVAEAHKPSLSPTSAAHLDHLRNLKTLVNLGCSEEFALRYSQSEGLDLQTLSLPTDNFYLEIQAHTVVVCGDQPDLKKYETTTFLADRIVLNGANLFGNQKKGSLTLNANHLALIGSNIIQTKGIDSTSPSSLYTDIKLNILESLDSENGGHLLIQSVGASFKKTDKGKLLRHAP